MKIFGFWEFYTVLRLALHLCKHPGEKHFDKAVHVSCGSHEKFLFAYCGNLTYFIQYQFQRGKKSMLWKEPPVNLVFAEAQREKKITTFKSLCRFSGWPVAQMVKKLPAMQETRVWSLGQEDGNPLSMLAWRVPWKSLVGYSPWGRKESATTEGLTLIFHRFFNYYSIFSYLTGNHISTPWEILISKVNILLHFSKILNKGFCLNASAVIVCYINLS